MTTFSQPAWIPESGRPWPGAEHVADAIEADQRADIIAKQAEVDAMRIIARREAEKAADSEFDSLRQVVGVRGSEVAIRRTRWLWRDRIPMGGLALLAGKGDVSKSTLFAEMVAWITTGTMKGEFYGQPKNVAYIVNEDSLSETVIPRMVAAGADMQRVFFIRSTSPMGEDAIMLPRDTEQLRAFLSVNDVVAVFVDPLSANVSGKKNDQGDMRATYQVINNLAEQARVAIIGLAHTRKAGAADVLEAVIGSSEQTNVARSVHGLVMDPEEDGARILSCEKLNVGQKHTLASLRFTVRSVMVPCTDGTGESTSMPKIHWLEEINETASDILTDQYHGNQNVDNCANWLIQYLESNGGQLYSHEVREEGMKKKFSASMIDRARKRVGVVSMRMREQGARTMWFHPNNDPRCE